MTLAASKRACAGSRHQTFDFELFGEVASASRSLRFQWLGIGLCGVTETALTKRTSPRVAEACQRTSGISAYEQAIVVGDRTSACHQYLGGGQPQSLPAGAGQPLKLSTSALTAILSISTWASFSSPASRPGEPVNCLLQSVAALAGTQNAARKGRLQGEQLGYLAWVILAQYE